MICPDYLEPGMKAGIVAPARSVSPAEMEPAMETLRSWGLIPVPGKHLYAADRQFAGTDAQRLADLQSLFDDPSVRLILCARGGYGTVRTVRKLDFTGFLRSPKWVVGFSDITVLHSLLQGSYQVESIHGPMALHFGGEQADPEGIEMLRKALFGEPIEYSWPAHPLNRPGSCRALLTGGNLSVLYSLRGSHLDLRPRHRLLFLEDLDEYLYHVDRMMQNLSLGGWLDGLNGLLLGGFSSMRDNEIPFGREAPEILADHARGGSFPVAFGFPAGHLRPNMPLILGRVAELEVRPEGSRLKFLPARGEDNFHLLKGE